MIREILSVPGFPPFDVGSALYPVRIETEHPLQAGALSFDGKFSVP
jgi:hypothetical protein